MVGLEQNEWLSVGYIHGDIDASDGSGERISSVSLRNLPSGNLLRIVTGKGGGNKQKIPASKHYILYPETFQGKKNLCAEMRRKTCVRQC